jgi:hypothetical protein
VYKRLIRGAQLIYCDNIEEFVRFAQPIGRFLAGRGIFIVRTDANGPVPGLVGKYFEGMEPRYYKGSRPRLGDLAFTQLAMIAPQRRKLSYDLKQLLNV